MVQCVALARELVKADAHFVCSSVRRVPPLFTGTKPVATVPKKLVDRGLLVALPPNSDASECDFGPRLRVCTRQ